MSYLNIKKQLISTTHRRTPPYQTNKCSRFYGSTRRMANRRIPDAGTIISSQVARVRTPQFLFPRAERQQASSNVNICLWIRTSRAYVTCEQTNAETRRTKMSTTILNLKVFRTFSLSHPRFFYCVRMRHLAARHVFQQFKSFFFFCFVVFRVTWPSRGQNCSNLLTVGRCMRMLLLLCWTLTSIFADFFAVSVAVK